MMQSDPDHDEDGPTGHTTGESDFQPLLPGDHVTFRLQTPGETSANEAKQNQPRWRSNLMLFIKLFVGFGLLALVIVGLIKFNWRKYLIILYLMRSAADEYEPQPIPPLGSGRLRNEMYGFCISRNIPAKKGEPPAENFLRCVGCNDTRYTSIQLHFRYNSELGHLETVDGECIMPDTPDVMGSRMHLIPCNEAQGQPAVQWRLTGMAGRQMQNGLNFCLDLEHQHRHGPLIQWVCKERFNYKPSNQLFTWIPNNPPTNSTSTTLSNNDDNGSNNRRRSVSSDCNVPNQ